MANIINDPAFKKKLEQMTPQVPPLSGEVEFPNLGQIAQQTAARVNATPPPLSGEATFPGLNQIGQETEMLVNAQQQAQPIDPVAFFEQRAGTPATAPAPQAESPFAPNPALAGMDPDFARQMNVPSEIITQPSAVVATPAISPTAPIIEPQIPVAQTPETQMATPESVAGLSIAGTPLTPSAITSPQVTPPSSPTTTASTATAGLPPGFGPVTSANIAAGRPANVSAGTVQVAQREAMQREAEMAADRAAKAFEDQLGFAGRPIAETDKMVAAYRANVLQDAMSKIDPSAAGAAGASPAGLTFEQQLALSKEQRAGRQEARDVATQQQEIQATDQEAFDKSLTNVRATQDAFNKLEPVAREIAKLSGGAFTEGGLGWVASKLPLSTDARQIERLSKELEGTTFLQGLIEAKAKGATFGALSEREGDRILAARGKLIAPESTNKQRIAAVNEMMETIQTSMERASLDHESKYGKSEEASTTPTTRGTTYSDNSNYEII